MLSNLDPKCQGVKQKSKAEDLGNKKHETKKNLSRGSLRNWCDANADADAHSSKTIFRPPQGVDITRKGPLFEILPK